jgi:ankyrin repeat protein
MKKIFRVFLVMVFITNLYASDKKLIEDWEMADMMGEQAKAYKILQKIKNKNVCGTLAGSLLDSAILNENYKLIKYLLEHGANPNFICRKPPITETGDIKIIKLLLKHGAKLEFNYYNNVINKNVSYTYLHSLVSRADDNKKGFELLKKLYNKLHLEKYINTTDENGETPIFYVKKNTELLSYLISKGADLYHENKEGRNVLIARVIYGGDKDIINTLIQKGLDVNAKTKKGSTPLMLAAQDGKKEAFFTLLKHGADVRAKKDGWTLLHYAAVGGDKDIINALIKRGLDVNAKTKSGIIPIMLTITNKNKDAFFVLLKNGANVNVVYKKNGNNLLHYAVFWNDKDIIKALIKRGVDLNKFNKKGYTPIMLAAMEGKKEAFFILLKNGADINVKGGMLASYSLLNCAALGGNLDIVKYLVEKKGFNINKVLANLAVHTPIIRKLGTCK